MSLPELSSEAFAANQNGQMTSQQRAKLREQQVLALLWLLLISTAGLAFIVSGVKDLNPNNLNFSMILLVILPLIVVGIEVILLVPACLRMEHDLKTGDVRSVTGKIEIGVRNSRSPRYKVTVNSMDFTISRELYKTLDNRKPHQIFYAPSSKTLLSIRRV